MPDAVARADPARAVRTLAGSALGTGWRVRFADGAVDDRMLRAAIDRRLAGIVAEMSQWEPASLLSRFNRAAPGTAMTLPPDFAAVAAAALRVAAASGGAFDPTHGRAAALLGFGAEPAALPPDAAAMDAAWREAGWHRLAFDPASGRLVQPGGLWLDFAGIAKGHAVDAVADVLAAHGLPDALVEIGGELAGRGFRPDRQPWWVDLEAPPGTAFAPLRIGLHAQAVATSGDYVRGAHTLDPRTGRPCAKPVMAVSVIHESAMLADAWATALAVLGPEEGAEIIRRERLAARLITREGGRVTETLTPALVAMIHD